MAEILSGALPSSTMFSNARWSPVGDSPFDFVMLGGQQTPGVVKFQGLGNVRKYEELGGPYLDASFLRYLGSQLAEFSLIISLHSQEDWEAWYAFQADVLRRPEPFQFAPKPPVALSLTEEQENPEKATLALSINHPFTAMHGISTVVVQAVLGPNDEGKGVWSFEIKLKEQRKPKTVAAGPVNGVRQGHTETEAQQRIRTLDSLADKTAQEAMALRDEALGAQRRTGG